MSVSFRLFLGDSLSDYSSLYTALETSGLAEFLTFTDLRLHLVYPATDGSEALAQPRDLVRYYYAIANIDIVAGLTIRLISILPQESFVYHNFLSLSYYGRPVE